MVTGLIYGYKSDEGWLYVGQVQSENLLKRHKRHMTLPSRLGKWLRASLNPSKPEILRTVTAENRRDLIAELCWAETEEMFRRHTYFPSFPSNGGFNVCLPLSRDYENIGKLGGMRAVELHGKPGTPSDWLKGSRAAGRISGPINVKKISFEARSRAGKKQAMHYKVKGGVRSFEMHGNPATKESCTKGGLKAQELYGSRLTQADRIKGAPMGAARSYELYGNPGTLAGRRKAMHNRWHVARNIPNPNCSLCGAQ